jgi:PAS domain S-box-containing protein
LCGGLQNFPRETDQTIKDTVVLLGLPTALQASVITALAASKLCVDSQVELQGDSSPVGVIAHDGTTAAKDIADLRRGSAVATAIVCLQDGAKPVSHSSERHGAGADLCLDSHREPAELSGFLLRWSQYAGHGGVSHECVRQQASQEEQTSILEMSADLVQQCREDGSLIYVNKSWQQRLGYDAATAANLSVFEIIHPDSLEHCKKIFGELMTAAPTDQLVELEFCTRDGERLSVEGNMRISDDVPGERITTGFFRDTRAREGRRWEATAMALVAEQVREMKAPADIRRVLTAVGEALQALAVPFDNYGINIVDDGHDVPSVNSYTANQSGDWIIDERIGEEYAARLRPVLESDGPTYRRDLAVEDVFEERAV